MTITRSTASRFIRQYSWARSSWRTMRDVLDLVDPQQHDRQVAGDARAATGRIAGPRRAGWLPTRPEAADRHRGCGAARRWKSAASLGLDAEMAELHLRLGPGQRLRPLEGVAVMVLVDRDRSSSSRDGATTVQNATRAVLPGAMRRPAGAGEDRVEHRADRVRQRADPVHRPRAVPRRGRGRGSARGRFRTATSPVISPSTTAKWAAQTRRSSRDAAGVSRGARRLGEVLGLDEQLGEGRVRVIGGRRRQHQLGVGGEFDLARLRRRYWRATRGGPRRRPRGRPDDLKRGRDRAVVAR